MADASNKQLNSIWTPANVITCVRILFIPLFMALALLSYHGALDFDPALSLAAFVLYMLLSLTDKVDGYLARSRNEITDFGKFLDPIADKLLVFSALLILLQQNTVNIWFVFIILLREFLVSALRMVASANGVVVAADKLGKWKTATTMVSLCGYLLSFVLFAYGVSFASMLLIFSQALMVIAVFLTVVSGLQYFWNCRKVVFRV